jgi:hypothetical protein
MLNCSQAIRLVGELGFEAAVGDAVLFGAARWAPLE